MSQKLQNIYDNKKFFSEYQKMREEEHNANKDIEIPIIKSFLPNLSEKRILDLGCGEGGMSKYFADENAKRILAIDISKNMIDSAIQKNKQSNITYLQLAMENLSQIDGKFDIVFSSLAFHYVEDFNKLIKDISNLLYSGGFLVFSQEHPLNTCTILESNQDSKIVLKGKNYRLLSDYNNNGKRHFKWNIDNVIKYHRNFETIINTLIKYGFVIEKIDETVPTEELIKTLPKYKKLYDKPYFLIIKAKKAN